MSLTTTISSWSSSKTAPFKASVLWKGIQWVNNWKYQAGYELTFEALIIALGKEQHGLGSTFWSLEQSLKSQSNIYNLYRHDNNNLSIPGDWDLLQDFQVTCDRNWPYRTINLLWSMACGPTPDHDGKYTFRDLFVETIRKKPKQQTC